MTNAKSNNFVTLRPKKLQASSANDYLQIRAVWFYCCEIIKVSVWKIVIFTPYSFRSVFDVTPAALRSDPHHTAALVDSKYHNKCVV